MAATPGLIDLDPNELSARDQALLLNAIQGARKDRQRKRVSTDFLSFVKAMDPEFLVGRHHKLMAEVFESMLEGKVRRVMISMPPGHLCAHDTPVPTPSGIRQHGDLDPGDLVYGPDGKTTRIIAVSKEAEADIDVEISNGDIITVHRNHRWTVWDRGQTKWRTVPTSYFIDPSPRTKRPIRLNQANTGGNGPVRYRFQLPLTAPIEGEPKDLPADPYMLGVWLGDGTQGKCAITWHPNDPEPIQEIRRRGFKVSSEPIHATTTCRTSYFGGKKGRGNAGRMTRELRAAEVWNNKHIPEAYFGASIPQRLDLLAGLLDSDGSLDKGRIRYRFVNCNKQLIDGVFRLAAGLGFRPYLEKREPAPDSTWGIESKQTAWAVNFAPTLTVPCKVKRKSTNAVVKQRRLSIVAVRPSRNPRPGRCITVDREDGLYLVDNMVTTHNSKSLMGSVFLPAWWLGRKPTDRILHASHTTSLVEGFSRQARNLIRDEDYRAIFPNTVLSTEVNRVEEWEIVPPKGRRIPGKYACAGVGTAIAGKRGNLGIIDDPISEQTAWSETARNSVNNWFPGGFRSRMLPGGCIVCIATRWHEDDLLGWLLRRAQEEDSEQWVNIDLPAILDDDAAKLLGDGAQAGEALFPELYDLEEMLSIKKEMPSWQWNALYMQRPTNEEGAILKRDYWVEWGHGTPPEKFTDSQKKAWLDGDYPEFVFTLQSWDTAFSKADHADFSACTTWGVFLDQEKTPHQMLCGAMKGRWDFPELVQKSLLAYQKWEPTNVLIEKKASGQSLWQELHHRGLPVSTYRPDKDKIARANAVSGILHGGRTYFMPRQATEDCIEECAAFPFGKHDDFVDSVTQALWRLREGRYSQHPEDPKPDTRVRRPRRRRSY